MFYLTQFMTDCVWRIPSLNAIVIASAEGSALEISDILSPEPVSLRDICEAFGPEFNRFTFGFMPKDVSGLEPFLHTEEDCSFFVQGKPLLGDLRAVGSFPAVAHA